MSKFLFLVACAWAGPKIVSTSPQVTELLFQLGKGGDVIATSDFSDFPAAAKKIPRIGMPFAYGVETIARFQPQWVLTEPNAAPPMIEKGLEALQVRHLSIPIRTVAAVYSQSERILSEIYAEKNRPLRIALPRAQSEFTFLAFSWLDPPILFGHTSFLSDLLAKVGGKNALPKDWKNPYPKISLEWLIKQKVSRIYFIAYADQTMDKAFSMADFWWPVGKPKIIGLPELFSRASFTPLEHAQELLP